MSLTVIIPLAGRGARFGSAGYSAPKPLVRAKGRPIVMRAIEALRLHADDVLLVVYHRSLDAYNFADLVRREFPSLQARCVPLASQTRGPAETVLLGLPALTASEASRPAIVVDGDSIMVDDVLEPMRRAPANRIFFFEDHDREPIYSYIDLRDDGTVGDIREKVRISNWACVGAYGFQSGELLRQSCQKTMALGRLSKNEFYLSDVYKTMIEEGRRVEAQPVERWDCLGTPLQLRRWVERQGTGDVPCRFCFDLDNTLVSYPTVAGDYDSCRPIERNIRFVQFLKNAGHHIIIHTGRRMRTHRGDVAAVIEDIGELTRRQLDRFGIPYDELIFGKPHADFYVDDLAVLPQAGLEQQTGFYLASEVEPRSWHAITWGDQTVRKHGPAPDIAREIAWYRSLPSAVADIAPRLIDRGDDWLEVERIAGIPMSQLHVGGVLQAADLGHLLDVLDRLHAHPADPGADVYANYAAKIQRRSEGFDASHLDGYGVVREQLMAWAIDYAARDGARRGLTHGDPVFTNVIVTPTHRIKLIDPRGELGGALTLSGDVLYDYAKMYQSLLGYDAVLQGVPQPRNDELVEYLRGRILLKYGEPGLSSVLMIAASLFFTLIPLHRQPLHGEFLELAKVALSLAR